MKRREFLAAAAAGVVAGAHGNAAAASGSALFRGKICLFSKHLPEMNWQELAQATREAGFGGVDLTVRTGGHVRPERAREDLPKAVAAIRGVGLTVPMITTELTSRSTPSAEAILGTAGELRIPFVKPGYYAYQFVDVRKEIERAGAQFRELTELAHSSGVQCGYHNHEGMIGGPVWDFAPTIEATDPSWAGYYFDVRHATAEGGAGGWRSAAHYVTPRLKMVAIKDCYWAKTPKGWQTINCPLGQGMVNWPDFMRILAQSGYSGPISLHLEYDIPGQTRAERERNTLTAAKRDLAYLEARLQDAYSALSDQHRSALP